jgi:hypothetical protein
MASILHLAYVLRDHSPGFTFDQRHEEMTMEPVEVVLIYAYICTTAVGRVAVDVNPLTEMAWIATKPETRISVTGKLGAPLFYLKSDNKDLNGWCWRKPD